jgi:diguanylate cyclase (GGDEF)-like protein/PAS domain S-box-containing protein
MTKVGKIRSKPGLHRVKVSPSTSHAKRFKALAILPRSAKVRTSLSGCAAQAVTIADLRMQRRDLTEKVELLQTTLDHLGHGIQMIDESGYVVVVNEQAITMLGVPPEMMKSKPHYTEVVAEQLNVRGLRGMAEALNGRAGVEEAIQQQKCYRRRSLDGRMLEINSFNLPRGGVVRIHSDITERFEAEEKIKRLASIDTLTGLANRDVFQSELSAMLEKGVELSVLLLDLDHFKEVNDTLGHAVGDSLLQVVAGRLKGCVREGDLVARLGGDEFAIIQPHPQGPPRFTDAAERIIESIKQPFDIEGSLIVVGISVGVAESRGGTGSFNTATLLMQADLALYESKADGRGAWKLFHPAMSEKVASRRTLETDLRQALAEQQFEIYYQPIVDLTTCTVSGFEALLRWNHPTRGLLMPDMFISAAEANGLIIPIGAWVLGQACSDAASWPEDLRLAVNLSPVQFRSPKLVEIVCDALAAGHLAPMRLELEITESVLMQKSEATMAVLTTLRERGVRIALDDFGTGFSSLSYVRSFPFDAIKIDRSFITGIGERRDCSAIVRAVGSLAHDLHMGVVAEGVETLEQLVYLQRTGCDEAQGYLFSRPRPGAEVPQMVARIGRMALDGRTRETVSAPLDQAP